MAVETRTIETGSAVRFPFFAERRLKATTKKTLIAWYFLLPTLLVLGVVAGLPLLSTFFYSFTDASLLSLDENPRLVGFSNYITILKDPQWWVAVRNTVVFAVASVGLETLLGLAIALVLNRSFRGKGVLRAAVLIPWAIPTVVSAKMWAWMYNDLYGVINHSLLYLHVIGEPIAWLSSNKTALLAVIIADVWKTTPFMALLILAGLQTIPKEVIEASRLDSPSRVKTFWAITLPLLRPTLLVAVVFRGLDALRVFDLIYVLTGNNLSSASMTVYARQRLMEFQEFGAGSAASMLIFVLIGGVVVLYLKLLTRRPEVHQEPKG